MIIFRKYNELLTKTRIIINKKNSFLQILSCGVFKIRVTLQTQSMILRLFYGKI